jgi:hypothetical protein
VFRTDSTYAVNLSDTESRAGLSVKSSSSFDSKLTISSGASSRQYIQAVNNAATTGRDIAINPYGGNVGIGTTSPAQKLDVAGSVRVQDRLYTNANATNTVGILGKATVNGWGARYDSNNANFSGFYFDGSHHSLILGRNAAGTITNYIHASGNSYFNGGNVGIGNTSPTYLLDVNEDDNVLAFRVTGGGGGNPIASFVRDVGSTGASVNIGASSNFPQIQFVSTGNTFAIGADSSGNFKISDNSTIGTNDRITIDNIGNVGIGTSSPSQKLDVVGSIEVSDGIYIGGTSAANKLDDYEQGTFDLEWGYGVFGGISYYDLSDFGGNKSETSTYVKVGRHVTVTSVFRYGSLPTAWSQSFGVVYLKLPFTVNTGYYANGAYSAFPGSSAAGSPSLFPTNYSSAFSLLGLHKSGLGGFSTFQTLTVGDMPGIGPSGYAEFKISFSFYTTS